MDDKKDTMSANIPLALSIPIGEVIKNWREFRGWSVTELATKAGLTKGYISQLENNKIKRPSDQHLAKLAGALRIEVWDVIARRMPSNRDTENREQVEKPEDIEVPFSEGAFHFPQPDQLDHLLAG
jgi:transcriptional regulator with XRE-family HTH domain